MNTERAPVIVVGVDDTVASREALAFALREGALRGSGVAIVTVWSWEGLYERLTDASMPEGARRRAQEIQDAAVAAVLEQLGTAAVVVSRQVVEGNAAEILVKAGKSAGYLVVGSSRKTAIKRALLGSVSEYCVRHSACPVVVVPEQAGQPSNFDASTAACVRRSSPSFARMLDT